MNLSLLRTVPLFLVSLVLTMMPSVTPSEASNSTKPPIDKSLFVPIINDIRESKRSILLMASLAGRHLVIVSAPGSSTLTEALVFEQSPESLYYKSDYIKEEYILTLRLETAPQLLTQKWPKLRHLTSEATCVALRDTFQNHDPFTYLSRNDYLLFGDAGKLTFLQLDTGDITQRSLNDSTLYGRLFADAILLSTFDRDTPMIFYRLLSRGSTHILKAEKVTFSSSEGRLPGFESFSISEQQENYICGHVQNHAHACGKELNWSITYGFQKEDQFYLIEALTSSIIRTLGPIFRDKPSDGTLYGSGYSSFPLVDFWALEQGDIRDPEKGDIQDPEIPSALYGIYLGVTLLLALALAFVAFKYGCKRKWGKQFTSSKKKKKKFASSSPSKGSISRSQQSKTDSSQGSSKKGSSSLQSTQA